LRFSNGTGDETKREIKPSYEIILECLCCRHHQKAGQNHDIKIATRHFENVAQFRYLGTTTRCGYKETGLLL
jgi:hypothetical protein